MPTPRAIIFDLGKVLVDFDYSIAARKIAARCEKPPADIRNFIDHSPLLFRYETGLLNREQFYDEICSQTGFCGDLAEFASAFADIFVPIPEMVEVHATLRAAGMPTYIFSNTNDIAIAHIRKNFPFFGQFDGYILSYEHGAMKPDPKLYEVVERQCGFRESQILYLDDRPENIETGAARGWQVILQESPQRTIAQLQRLGLLPSLKASV